MCTEPGCPLTVGTEPCLPTLSWHRTSTAHFQWAKNLGCPLSVCTEPRSSTFSGKEPWLSTFGKEPQLPTFSRYGSLDADFQRVQNLCCPLSMCTELWLPTFNVKKNKKNKKPWLPNFSANRNSWFPIFNGLPNFIVYRTLIARKTDFNYAYLKILCNSLLLISPFDSEY